MKIAVLHPELSNHSIQRPDPAQYCKDYALEHFNIRNEHAKGDVDAVVSKRFDFFLILTAVDNKNATFASSGVEYLEELGLDYIGATHSVIRGFRATRKRRFTAGQTTYSCLVIEIYNTPFALSPVLHNSDGESQDFTILEENDDPSLFHSIKRKAIECATATNLTSISWCSVKIRRTPPRAYSILHKYPQLSLVEVTSTPPIFLPTPSWEDQTITHSFPGTNSALLHTLLSTYFLHKHPLQNPSDLIAEAYDKTASTYDSHFHADSKYGLITAKMAEKYDYNGTIIDLGAGSGMFGKLLAESEKDKPEHEKGKHSITALDVSKEMLKLCALNPLYTAFHTGPIQRLLPGMDKHDHVVSCGVLYFLSHRDFFLILSTCFLLARKSITLTIEEPPAAYFEELRADKRLNESLPDACLHVEDVEAFLQGGEGEVRGAKGWRLVDRWREWGFVIRGHDVFTTVARFERAEDV